PLAAQHGAAVGAEPEAAMALDVDNQEAERHQLAEHRAPLLAAEFLTDAPGDQPVMAELAQPLALAAHQHLGQVRGAEALAGAIDARQRLLRRDRAVEAGDRLQAGVAIAAGLAALLAEIIEQHLAAATRGLAEADQRVELAPLDLLLLLGQLRGFRHAAQP